MLLAALQNFRYGNDDSRRVSFLIFDLLRRLIPLMHAAARLQATATEMSGEGERRVKVVREWRSRQADERYSGVFSETCDT